MQWPASLSRPEFDNGCKILLKSNQSNAIATDDVLHEAEIWSDWEWREHPRHAGFGYMTRRVPLRPASRSSPEGTADDLDTDEGSWTDLSEIISDPATANPFILGDLNPETVTVAQHVVWSQTFRVPVFYFSAYDNNGSPISLDCLLKSGLLSFALPPSALSVSSDAVALPSNPSSADNDASIVPLLTQGEHPTTGERCWYLHPCETSAAVIELLEARHGRSAIKQDMAMRWLECWFLILGKVINLRAGGSR